jgi:hypothetical protein
MKRLVVILVALLPLTLLAADLYVPTDSERARWTMFDMRSWKTVFDAYKLDHGQYPVVRTVEEARAIGEPTYVKHAPMIDAWGRPYRIESDAKSFRIVSAGADGIFQSDVSTGGTLQSFNEDAVATEAGNWLFRHWEMK